MSDEYPPLSGDLEDDGTMPENVAELAAAIVGHRIAKVERGNDRGPGHSVIASWERTRLTLDDGTVVELRDTSDCCAYTELKAVIEHLPSIDHVITAVRPEPDYETWHILADAGEVLELVLSWSPGNPFWYGYGFAIAVTPPRSR